MSFLLIFMTSMCVYFLCHFFPILYNISRFSIFMEKQNLWKFFTFLAKEIKTFDIETLIFIHHKIFLCKKIVLIYIVHYTCIKDSFSYHKPTILFNNECVSSFSLHLPIFHDFSKSLLMSFTHKFYRKLERKWRKIHLKQWLMVFIWKPTGIKSFFFQSTI